MVIPEFCTCDRCKKKYDPKNGGAVTLDLGTCNFAVINTLCTDCLEELRIWILKGTEDIQKMQDLEQAQLDKAYEIGYQIGYEEGKNWKEKEEDAKISRIEKALHGKTAKEQYKFMHWLLNEYGMEYNHTELAIIAWLKGEEE